MKNTSYVSLNELVDEQVRLLNAGDPLGAFDKFYASDVSMFSNGELFASGAEEGRAKQEPFISFAKSIRGNVTDVFIAEDQNICVFRNHSTFTSAEGTDHRINGLCWQMWKNSLIIEERYYDGAQMEKLIEDGILKDPTSMR